jgi:hypothetical protein
MYKVNIYFKSIDEYEVKDVSDYRVHFVPYDRDYYEFEGNEEIQAVEYIIDEEHRWFKTFEEAKKWLVEETQQDLKDAELRFNNLTRALARVESIKEPIRVS